MIACCHSRQNVLYELCHSLAFAYRQESFVISKMQFYYQFTLHFCLAVTALKQPISCLHNGGCHRAVPMYFQPTVFSNNLVDYMSSKLNMICLSLEMFDSIQLSNETSKKSIRISLYHFWHTRLISNMVNIQYDITCWKKEVIIHPCTFHFWLCPFSLISVSAFYSIFVFVFSALLYFIPAM